MVEQGLVMLVQAGIATAFSPAVPGGYGVQLPKDIVSAKISDLNPKAWVWRTISLKTTYTIDSQVSLKSWRVEIQCHGYEMPDAILLAAAIDGVLRGNWSGTLPDPDSTKVDSIRCLPGGPDGYSDTNRSYVRSLEYSVQFYQS